MSETLDRARTRSTPAFARSPCAHRALAAGSFPSALVVLWQAASSAGLLSDSVLPSPLAVLAAGWRLTLTGELPRNVEVSFLRAMAGLVVGGGIGFALRARQRACRRSANG